MPKINNPISFLRGPKIKNRFMLAPLTNCQSHEDGILSEEEYHWLTMRAKGGFGLVMTCATHVQAVGQGFPGQLGIFSDDHIEGLTKLARGINEEGSISILQLHHAGKKTLADLIGEIPVSPSGDKKTGARALSHEEVILLIEDFVEGAVRAEKAGFHGVELHGAHGYMICQFLSAKTNSREDEFGGSFHNRASVLFRIIDGIRERCGDDFIVGVRLSPEGVVKLEESIALAKQLMMEEKIDFLDMSLWDVFKEPLEEAFQGQTLMSYFTRLNRKNVKLGVAGKIRTPAEVEAIMQENVDWIMLGRAAILHHDFPNRFFQKKEFRPVENPVSREHLESEGVSKKFITYLESWPGFVGQ
ncbi:MAG: NADH:flavin oxidoreductase [Candidatus Azotimanducaceae bacterium]|nr:NADH:flavin oxidoreductase [Gammaproteobacteria bacterium]